MFNRSPWGSNFSKDNRFRTKHGRKLKYHENLVYYNDNQDDKFDSNWFNEVKRICKIVIVCLSRKKSFEWMKKTNFLDQIIIYFKNGIRPSKISINNNYSSYLVYSDNPIKNKLDKNVLETYIENGFLKKRNYIHPSAKSSSIFTYIIKKLKVESVLDPFLGSGTIAESCESLGIPWIGFEIMEEYKVDIDKRIALGKKEFRKPKQEKLF